VFHLGPLKMTTLQSISRHFAQCPQINRITLYNNIRLAISAGSIDTYSNWF